MYRKRMSDALQEARAFSLVNEVMVFKGGRGMNVSKQDLPVFKAKGWKLKEELEEANMKRLLQALQDKLSKEGGAAGFDDLKKTAKTMGVNLTPDMLKGAPGIKQHRDGDYILEGTITEEELDEALDVKWDSNKQGWFDRQGRRRYLGVMATNKLMAKALDKAKKTGDFINPYKLKHGQKPEETELEENKSLTDLKKMLDKTTLLTPKEKKDIKDLEKKMSSKDYHKALSKMFEQTELEEAFSKKDFQKLEQSNDHTEAAKKLIDMFGTSDEKKEMNDIKARHEKTGYISGTDYSKRIKLVNRYYSRLK